MSRAASGRMDPTNPRWEPPKARYRRQKLLWTVIVTAAVAVAGSTMIVVSCLDRDPARRAADTRIVETTAAPAPAPGMRPRMSPSGTAPPAAPATNDSTGGTDGDLAGAGTTTVTSALFAQPSPPVRAPTDTSSGIPHAIARPASVTTGADAAPGPP